MPSGPITSWQIDWETMEMETMTDFLFLGSKITADGSCNHEIKRCFLQKMLSSKKSYNKPRQHITKQRRYFADKGPYSQTYGFSSGHVWIWKLDCEESWVPKNWRFWTVVLEKTLENPLDCTEIKPVILKEISPEYSLEGLMLKLKLQYWTTWCKALTHLEKNSGKDWRQEKGMTEDERVGWHHWLNGHEFEQAPGICDGQGGQDSMQSMGLQRVGHDWMTELNWKVFYDFWK